MSNPCLHTAFFRKERHFCAQPLVFVIGLVMTTTLAASAQESIRTSQRPALRTFRAPTETNLINIGPFHGNAALGLGYDFTDNADFSGTTSGARISRNQISESLGLALAWLVTPVNRVDLQGGVKLEENFYSNGHSALNVAISPGTEIRLQAFVGDVKIEVFDQFAIVQDTASDPTASGQTNLNRLGNTIGVTAAVPVWSATLTGEADYTYSQALSSSSGAAGGGSRNTFHGAGGATFYWSPAVQYGVVSYFTHSIGGSTTGGSSTSDENVVSFGGFVKGRLTRLIEFDFSAGLTILEGTGISSPGYYVTGGLRYQLNRQLQLIAGVLHDYVYSAGLDLTELTSFTGGVQYTLQRGYTVEVTPFYNFGTVKTGTTPGNFPTGQRLDWWRDR
jgi:hypothetical protein